MRDMVRDEMHSHPDRILRFFRRISGFTLNSQLYHILMDPFIVAVILIIAGAAFLIYEAFSPGAFMVIPGTVLVIVGLIGAAFPDKLYTWWSPLIALVVAVPVTLLTIKGYQRLAVPAPPPTTAMDSLVGREGTVTVPTEVGNMKGKVKIGSDTWSATSDEPLDEGTVVIVEHSEGVHVHVRRR